MCSAKYTQNKLQKCIVLAKPVKIAVQPNLSKDHLATQLTGASYFISMKQMLDSDRDPSSAAAEIPYCLCRKSTKL